MIERADTSRRTPHSWQRATTTPSADQATMLLRAAEAMELMAPSGKMAASAALPEGLRQP